MPQISPTARFGAVFFAMLLMVAMGCSPNDQHQSKPAGQKAGQGQGVVQALDLEHLTITLTHEKIPNVTEAATKGYRLEDAALLQDVLVGDTVLFALKEAVPGEFIVTSLEPYGFNPLMENHGNRKEGMDTGRPSAARPRGGRPIAPR